MHQTLISLRHLAFRLNLGRLFPFVGIISPTTHSLIIRLLLICLLSCPCISTCCRKPGSPGATKTLPIRFAGIPPFKNLFSASKSTVWRPEYSYDRIRQGYGYHIYYVPSQSRLTGQILLQASAGLLGSLTLQTLPSVCTTSASWSR